MGKYKYKIKETLKASKVDPAFLKNISKTYGEVDTENDFFSDNLDTYFKADEHNPQTGSQSHKVIKLSSFGESLEKLQKALTALVALSKSSEGRSDSTIQAITQQMRNLFNKYRTHLRTDYPDQYNSLKDLIDEMSSTGGGAGAASFTPGTGMQYATPKAFNKNKKSDGTASNYYYKLGFKKVPDKIKNSGLEVKQLFEDEVLASDVFQKKRIAAFDDIEKELNNLHSLLSNSKNETIEYYNENPGSYGVVTPTDLILSYIKDIKDLLGV